MSEARYLLATRNRAKAREIRRILAVRPGVRLLTLGELDLAPSPEEDMLEAFDTFRENALAKAVFFAQKSGLATIADDSGLVVDALDGRPGVRSRRFAADAGHGAEEGRGESEDEANNRWLLESLAGVPEAERGARYVCVAALVQPGGQSCSAIGTWRGRIATAPRGRGGFGYDPLFLLPERGLTVAELPPGEKNRSSHRARAFRALVACF